MESTMTFRAVEIDGRARVAPADQAAPILDWVRIDRLRIDDRYQRPLGPQNWKAIEAIAAEFRWSRFAPVLLAPLPDGLFAVIDGQHRAHAAAICGYESVPAMVVPMTMAEQASGFAAVNGRVIKVTAHQVYRAALAAGEGWAVRCNDLVELAGCRLMAYKGSAAAKKAGEIYCVQLVRDLVARGHAEALRIGLTALRAYDTTGRVPLWSDYILRPWLSALTDRPNALRLDLVAFLQANDLYKILNAAHQARLRGEVTTDREAIVRALDKVLIANALAAA